MTALLEYLPQPPSAQHIYKAYGPVVKDLLYLQERSGGPPMNSDLRRPEVDLPYQPRALRLFAMDSGESLAAVLGNSSVFFFFFFFPCSLFLVAESRR